MNFNIDLFFQIHNLAYKNPLLDLLMIFGAEYLIFIVGFSVIAFFFFGKSQDKKAAILAFLGLIFAFILVKLIRVFYFEPRPFVTFPINPLVKHEADTAFPSVHTTIISTIALAYTYYKSKLGLFFLLSLLWIGFARILVGVHYPLDILGGILVGFLSIFSTTTLLKKLAT